MVEIVIIKQLTTRFSKFGEVTYKGGFTLVEDGEVFSDAQYYGVPTPLHCHQYHTALETLASFKRRLHRKHEVGNGIHYLHSVPATRENLQEYLVQELKGTNTQLPGIDPCLLNAVLTGEIKRLHEVSLTTKDYLNVILYLKNNENFYNNPDTREWQYGWQ